MSNEVTKKNGSQMASFNYFDAEQFETIQRVCRLFASSELVPDSYRALPGATQEETESNKKKAIANCMIAIEMAQRIGASPLMIMQNLTIIYGRPSWSSTFLIATINTCGRFEPLKFRIEDKGMVGDYKYTEYETEWKQGANGRKYKETKKVDKTFDGKNVHNYECVAYTCERGTETVLESSPISITMAIDEGWYTKSGSKWKTMPKQMLMYRAASFWQRLYAPELGMGMHTTEEVIDMGDAKIVDVTDVVDAEIVKNGFTETVNGIEEPQQESEQEPEQAESNEETAPAAPAAPAPKTSRRKPTF